MHGAYSFQSECEAKFYTLFGLQGSVVIYVMRRECAIWEGVKMFDVKIWTFSGSLSDSMAPGCVVLILPTIAGAEEEISLMRLSATRGGTR